MASKKEPKAKAKKAPAGRDGPGEAKSASKKPKPVKRKTAAKKSAGKKESKQGAKRDSAKHHKIRIPVALDKKNAGSKKGALSKTDAGGTAKAELDPFEVAKERVKGSVPAIVDAMVEKAKQGSCTHAKTLLEMTGARHMFDGEGGAANSGEPWAKLVLERLDEADGRESAGLQVARATSAEQ